MTDDEWLTQPICDDCWIRTYADPEPTRVTKRDWLNCYRCGTSTASGIYVNVLAAVVRYRTNWDAPTHLSALRRMNWEIPGIRERPEDFYVIDARSADCWNVETGRPSDWFSDTVDLEDDATKLDTQ